MIVCIFLSLIIAFKPVSADETKAIGSQKTENSIALLYSKIDFSKYRLLSYEAFSQAYRGYLNLRNAGMLNTDKDILSVCDLSLSSKENRLWIIDLAEKKVLFNTYVAHGQGSGDEFAEQFSNNSDSHQTSLGFYVTGDTYKGDHGTALHLEGMDKGYNDAAYQRGIVVHGAQYVCDKFVCANQKLGRSWGCPAVPAKLSLRIINTIKEGTCLFIYYPDKEYSTASCWLNRNVTTYSESNIYSTIMQFIYKSKS